MKPMLRLALFFACGILASCSAVGPDYVAPEIETPVAFSAEFGRGLAAGDADVATWWAGFGDPVLERLVQDCLAGNLDLSLAMARIREARALRGISSADYLPTVDVTGAYSRNQNSRKTEGGEFAPRAFDDFRVGAEAAWELDLWGRISRTVEAADAEIDVTVEDARAVIVSIVAETGLAYVDLRNNQERAAIALSNIEIQKKSLGLTEDQFIAGLVSELDVAQAAAILESTRATLPPLESAARAARRRLAVLSGRHPGTLETELAEAGIVPMPPIEIAVGVPADLLRRRPDLRRAERRLAAQTARIGAAEAELYPEFTLTGQIGLAAEDAGQLAKGGAALFGIRPGVRWNLFDSGRLRSRVAAEDARAAQALIDYERTVLFALEEVENAMTAFVDDQESRESLEKAVGHARRALELSQEQYRRGLTGFQNVLDSQRRLFELEDRLAITKAFITANLIGVFRALGGGWEGRDVVLLPAEEKD